MRFVSFANVVVLGLGAFLALGSPLLVYAQNAPVLPGSTGNPGPPMLPGQGIPVLPGADGALPPGPGLGAAPGSDFDFEKSQEEIEQETRTEAFKAAIQSVLPLKPDEIRTLLEQFDRTQESVEVPVYPTPKPEVVVETISLDPGAAPAVVHVSYGHVTTLTTLDVTGAPWPIEDISWAGNFEVIETSSSGGSHILRISPQSEFATGNISIRMLTLKTPVILTLETRRDSVHYRFDAVIPEYGPMAEAPLIEKGITTVAGSLDLTTVLQGVAPTGAKKLDVSGVDGRTSAYSLKGLTYVRTPMTLLSPAWNNSVSSSDGMRVYTIPETPVLLLSDKGKLVRARISKRPDGIEDAIQ